MYSLRIKKDAGKLVSSLYFLIAPIGFCAPSDANGATFSQSGLDGAGFQNVIAVNPGAGTSSKGGDAIDGADTAGFFYTVDGNNLSVANGGEVGNNQMHVASMEFSKVVANKVYALTGDGQSGGFLSSTDGGQNWTLTSASIVGNGSNSGIDYTLQPNQHPRSVGRLIALDDTSSPKRIYVGTFQDGVYRSTNGGVDWTRIGLVGKAIRSLVIDPLNPDVLYVGCYPIAGDNSKGMIWKTSTARNSPQALTGNGSFTQLVTAPPVAEELLHLGNTHLYAACGVSGIFRSTNHGAGWTRIGGATTIVGTDAPAWCSIDGFLTSGVPTLYISSDCTTVSTDRRQRLLRSTTGSFNFVELATDAAVNPGVPGQSYTWWLGLPSGEPSNMLDGRDWIGSQIAIDPTNHQRIFIAGKSGAWRSLDGGSTWRPLVHGLQATINRTVKEDPNVSGRLYIGNVDYQFLQSTDYFASVERHAAPGESVGYAIALKTSVTPSIVYWAKGDRDNNQLGGEVYTSTDPLTTDWTPRGFEAAAGGAVPYGIAYGTGATGADVLLVAAAESGIWRKEGTASWQQVETRTCGAATTPKLWKGGKTADFAWKPGVAVCYLHDPNTGLWRSNDYGLNWDPMWTQTAALSMPDGTGYILVDPTTAGRIYFSANSDVYRLDGCNIAGNTVENGLIIKTIINSSGGGIANPGPIALQANVLYVCSTTVPIPHLIKITNPGVGDGDSPLNIDDATYRNAATAAAPKGLVVTADSYIYLVGKGGMKGTLP